MSKFTPAQDVEPEDDAAPTWADARAALGHLEPTDLDYLHLFAGDDDDEAKEAPASVREDPALLLVWCRVHQPTMVLDENTAMIAALNRRFAELQRQLRRGDAKRHVTPADALAYLEGESLL